MLKKNTHRGTATETARNSVKDGGAVEPEPDTSRRARAPRRQPQHGVGTRWRQSPSLAPRRSPSLRARQSPSAIALILSRKGKGKHVRREATRCNRLGSVVLTLGELRRITKDFSDDQLVGEGAFGKVYKGVLTNGDMIAVKRFASTITGLQDVHYKNEAQRLMRLKHPNIVQFVGYCSETKMKLVQHNGTFVYAEETERLLCLEYMPKGSLGDHLSESSRLDWKTCYKIIEGICYGLHYLHEDWQATPIIHMDLKPANILLDDNMVPKIADFGLSRLFGEDQTRTCTTSCKGTLGYMAPEYLEKGVITKKFDIFSLGVIIIEIITGLKGYPTDETATTSHQYIDRVLNDWRNRLREVQGTSQDIDYQQIKKCIQIGLLCVKFDPAKRPTINQIIKMLERSDEAYQNEIEMREEAAKAPTSLLSRAPSLSRTLVDQNQPPRYKLSFVNGLETEVFMNKVLCDIDGEPLTIRVIANDQDAIDAHILNAKIEVVVLHGDFNRHNQESWTREEFCNSIVRPEDEFRVILTGTLQLSLTNGEADLRGATFTGSSRFVRNGRFRLGVMVTDDLGERVQEGITKPFVVQEAAAAVENLDMSMPPKKRKLEDGGAAGGGREDGAGSSTGTPLPASVLKKRCRSFDLEIRGCRHLQELAAAMKTNLEAALESAVARTPEEVAKALTSFLSRAPSLCRTLFDQNQPPRYKLCFMNGLDTEVFTKKPICDADEEPLKIRVVANGQDGIDDAHILSARVKVVVLDGDFNRHNQECWTPEEFSNSVVRPRDKVGAVLTGDLELSLVNGEACLRGATFMDNSKFVRSGKFRLGVMVVRNPSERVQEGITEPFIVKDRRGERSKKHDVPLLNDYVWRLKKIAKNGAYHVALRGSGILLVKDFLRLYYKNQQALRNILTEATEVVWMTIVEHAKKCDPGQEIYSYLVEGNSVMLFFNSVCQIIGATFVDHYSPFDDLEKITKDLVVQWSKVAYENMSFDQPDYEMVMMAYQGQWTT